MLLRLYDVNVKLKPRFYELNNALIYAKPSLKRAI